MHRVFFGHHKCASRFFRLRVFGPLAISEGWDVVTYDITDHPYHFTALPDLDLDQVDFGRLSRSAPAVVNLLNSSPDVHGRVLASSTGRFRGLRVLRDPRQVLVSGYFHHLAGHPIESENGFVWDALARDRPVLQSLSTSDGLIYEMDHIGGSVLTDQLGHEWHDERVMVVRVEDVNHDRAGFLSTLWEHLEVDDPPVISWNQRFSDSGASDWRVHFDPPVRDAFKERFGDLLIALGYETGRDW